MLCFVNEPLRFAKFSKANKAKSVTCFILQCDVMLSVVIARDSRSKVSLKRPNGLKNHLRITLHKSNKEISKGTNNVFVFMRK